MVLRLFNSTTRWIVRPYPDTTEYDGSSAAFRRKPGNSAIATQQRRARQSSLWTTAVLQQVVSWARRDENVRLAVLTGSVARGNGAFDDLSDLDVELYVRDPVSLLSHAGWYEQFGEVLVVEALQNPGWHPTRLVYYTDGKIDFMIAATTELARPISCERSFQVFLDKDDAKGVIRRRFVHHEPRPVANAFLECVRTFYAAAIMWATYLVRDDPWSAKVRDWDSKRQLLQMVEWDQTARSGGDFATWRSGAHLREWVDPALLREIDRCWCGCSRQDSAEALRASMSLFGSVSARAAVALGLEPFVTPDYTDALFKYFQPMFMAELAAIVWLLIGGAKDRTPAAAVTT